VQENASTKEDTSDVADLFVVGFIWEDEERRLTVIGGRCNLVGDAENAFSLPDEVPYRQETKPRKKARKYENNLGGGYNRRPRARGKAGKKSTLKGQHQEGAVGK